MASSQPHHSPEEELESDVELVERVLPIPGHEERFPGVKPQSTSSSFDDPSEDSGSSITASVTTEHDSDASEGRPNEAIPSAEDGRIPHIYPIPKWFPQKIKRMFNVDRKGGALKFKELDQMTMYRTVLERAKRVCWRTYLDAGRKRYQFQRFLRRYRFCRLAIPTFYKFQKTQYKKWKEKAFEEWKVLEKMHLGVRVLDEAIHLNFRMERLLYEKRLGGRFRG